MFTYFVYSKHSRYHLMVSCTNYAIYWAKYVQINSQISREQNVDSEYSTNMRYIFDETIMNIPDNM